MKKIVLIASFAAITLVNCAVTMQKKKSANKETLIKGFDRLNEYMRKNPGKISVETLREVMQSKAARRFVDKHGKTDDFKETQRLIRTIGKSSK